MRKIGILILTIVFMTGCSMFNNSSGSDGYVVECLFKDDYGQTSTALFKGEKQSDVLSYEEWVTKYTLEEVGYTEIEFKEKLPSIVAEDERLSEITGYSIKTVLEEDVITVTTAFDFNNIDAKSLYEEEVLDRQIDGSDEFNFYSIQKTIDGYEKNGWMCVGK